MKKKKIGQLVVLTHKLAYGCQTVDSGTICKIKEVLDDNHVCLNICPNGFETRNSNIEKFRLPNSPEEERTLAELFNNANELDYARID